MLQQLRASTEMKGKIDFAQYKEKDNRIAISDWKRTQNECSGNESRNRIDKKNPRTLNNERHGGRQPDTMFCVTEQKVDQQIVDGSATISAAVVSLGRDRPKM